MHLAPSGKSKSIPILEHRRLAESWARDLG
jgi:hypothetical protein